VIARRVLLVVRVDEYQLGLECRRYQSLRLSDTPRTNTVHQPDGLRYRW